MDPATLRTAMVKQYAFPNTTIISDVAIWISCRGQFIHILGRS